MAIVLTVLAFWLFCGVFAWGANVAEMDFCRRHRWRILDESMRAHVGFCAAGALLGPIGALVALFATNFCEHGWMLWPDDTRRPSEMA